MFLILLLLKKKKNIHIRADDGQCTRAEPHPKNSTRTRGEKIARPASKIDDHVKHVLINFSRKLTIGPNLGAEGQQLSFTTEH